MKAFCEDGESEENFLRSCVSATSRSMVVTPSVVNRGTSLKTRVPGVMSRVAMRPSPFPGMGAISQRDDVVSSPSWEVDDGRSGSVVRLRGMAIYMYGYGY
jgi:hypothetical protein